MDDRPSTRSLAAAAAVLLAASAWAFTVDVTPEPAPTGVRVGANDAYNPVLAGEDLPDGFRQLLPRDAIRPVYEPSFTTAADTVWPDDAEVIGVAFDDGAKAYPVSFLNGRELVVDELEGIPILVSW